MIQSKGDRSRDLIAIFGSDVDNLSGGKATNADHMFLRARAGLIGDHAGNIAPVGVCTRQKRAHKRSQNAWP